MVLVKGASLLSKKKIMVKMTVKKHLNYHQILSTLAILTIKRLLIAKDQYCVVFRALPQVSNGTAHVMPIICCEICC